MIVISQNEDIIVDFSNGTWSVVDNLIIMQTINDIQSFAEYESNEEAKLNFKAFTKCIREEGCFDFSKTIDENLNKLNNNQQSLDRNVTTVRREDYDSAKEYALARVREARMKWERAGIYYR